jgi:hypothetical protein
MSFFYDRRWTFTILFFLILYRIELSAEFMSVSMLPHTIAIAGLRSTYANIKHKAATPTRYGSMLKNVITTQTGETIYSLVYINIDPRRGLTFQAL